MTYKARILERKVRNLTSVFGAVLVTGPRQAGKTSLLNFLAAELFPEGTTVAFDTPAEVGDFRRDPNLFFANHPGFLFLDEIQHVPDIFPYLKREIDRSPGSFRFFLSGSQHFELMKGVTESLAGRTAVLDLWPFCVQETRSLGYEVASRTLALLRDPSGLEALVGAEHRATDPDDVVPGMLAGGYPPVALTGAGEDWLEAYRRTYLQRDIRELSHVADLGLFDRFLVLCAGRSGTILNKHEMSQTLGVDHKTVDRWLSLLETSYQGFFLPAYHTATTKRIARRPKWVFADSGLGLHLQGIRDARGLLNAPHFGNLFEAWVVSELRKLHGHVGLPWDAFFWRTQSGLECDLVLAAAGRLVPVEIKHAASISARDLNALHAFLDEYPKAASAGVLISLSPRVERLSERVYNVPLGLILDGPG